MPIRTFRHSLNQPYNSTPEYIANAFNIALSNWADVLICSWNVAPSQTIKDAIDRVVNCGRDGKGAVVLAASGNDYPNYPRVDYPARLASVIAVGASDMCNERQVMESLATHRAQKPVWP